MSHKAWLQVLRSDTTLAYETEELRCQLDKKSKEAFMDHLGYECFMCILHDRWWRNGNVPRISPCGKLQFHHKKAKLMNIGSFRVTKNGLIRKHDMIHILEDVNNCVLVCDQHHRQLHAH